jgi:hypothetical protein
MPWFVAGFVLVAKPLDHGDAYSSVEGSCTEVEALADIALEQFSFAISLSSNI